MDDISMKAARVDRGYTQEALAEKLGITKQTYIKWENGEAVPKPMFVYAVAYILNLDADIIRIPQKNF